jgi:hypothetical protein
MMTPRSLANFELGSKRRSSLMHADAITELLLPETIVGPSCENGQKNAESWTRSWIPNALRKITRSRCADSIDRDDFPVSAVWCGRAQRLLFGMDKPNEGLWRAFISKSADNRIGIMRAIRDKGEEIPGLNAHDLLPFLKSLAATF